MAASRLGKRDPVDVIIAQWEHEIPDLDVSAFAVFGRLHRAYARYAVMLTSVFDKHGINMASFDVLAALRRSGPPYRRTAGELAGIGLITTGGLTLRLDRLEKAGLITRERDADDRRVVYAQLTETGLEITNLAAREHFAYEMHMLSALSKSQRDQLADLLAELERSLLTADHRLPPCCCTTRTSSCTADRSSSRRTWCSSCTCGPTPSPPSRSAATSITTSPSRCGILRYPPALRQ